jgi:hypothetical protein
MQKQNESIDLKDFIAIPVAALLSFVFHIWLPWALATSLSVVLVLFACYLFEARRITAKRAIGRILLIGVIVFALSFLFHWYY